MYPYYPYRTNVSWYIPSYPVNPYVPCPQCSDGRVYPAYPFQPARQQPVKGQATWTEGGQVTQCGIPWSDNLYMTAAVGENTPYQCGQTLKIRNVSIPAREIFVTVVDKVPGYPVTKINLHKKAFEALGANPEAGVMDIEIISSPELEQARWGKYLLELTQTAYPGYNVTDYKSIGKTEVSQTKTKETYEYILESPQERIKVRGTVMYNPKTDRVFSFDLKEV